MPFEKKNTFAADSKMNNKTLLDKICELTFCVLIQIIRNIKRRKQTDLLFDF